jgi:osmotically-inducible protein OsmY
MQLLTLMDAPTTITEVAMERLGGSPYQDMRRISCECQHGVLFLRGRFFSFHKKQVAQETVAGIDGVTQVVNDVEVISLRNGE